MGLVAKRVSDRRILTLICGFLTAGVLADGLVGPTDEGTPQGGPFTPPTILQTPTSLGVRQ
jgi:RNA-directed DNA polymerase